MKTVLLQKILPALAFIFCVFVSSAQSSVTGVVSDANGVPIPYVNVLEEGTTNGSISDIDGAFSIEVSDADTAQLKFTSIGFVTQSISLDGKTTLNITLKEDVAALDEVVVVGYGTQKRRDVTGAVASANLEAFEEAPNTNIAQSLQGTTPGLNVGQVNSAGSTPEITIRGTSTLGGNGSVLIVLDGIQYNGSLSSLNPSDIASIDVLKDASSTAVYGAQASNGVILITSKKGRRNQKARITISSSYATQQPSEDYRPMRRGEYIDFIERQLYDQRFLAPDFTTPNPDYPGYFLVPGINANPNLAEDPSADDADKVFSNNDYDWWDEGTQTGFVQENRINVTGGSENISYLMSVGLTEQEGYINNDNFSRKSVRVNLDADATDWWKVGVQTFGSFVKQDGDEPSLTQLVNQSPLLLPRFENGELNPTPAGTIELNPFLGSNTQDYERHDYFFANLFSEIQLPLKGLKYRLNFGNNYRIDKLYGSSIYGAGQTGDAGKEVRFYKDYNLDNILTYTNAFGKHDITSTLLYGAIERRFESTNAYASGFQRLTLGYNDLGVGSIPRVSSSAYTERLNYQMFRVNYKFDNRYLLTATIRRDGFSGFAENEKTAYFPSAALGWNVSNESFMQNVEWVNNLKVRATYGIAGNQTTRYQSLARLGTRAAYVFGDGSGPAFGQELGSLPNPNLRWEKTTGVNLGIDFSLFSSRLTGSLDVYDNTTNDLLFNVRVPYLTGFDRIQTNVGELQNKGLELSITGDIVRNQDFSWTVTGNFSTNKNEILELTGEDADGDGVEDDLIQSSLFIGESINAIFGYEVNGIYQIGDDIPEPYSPGRYRVVDQNNDGIIDIDDRKILGTRDPAYRFSILNTLRYKGLSLGIFINSIQGNKNSYLSYNDNAVYRNANTLYQNRLGGIDYWSPQNPDGLNAVTSNTAGTLGTRLENRSFIRLQDVNLKYNFSGDFLDKLSIAGLSIFVSGKNLVTWTDWNGWDPEFQDTGRNIFGVGLGNGGRPLMKGYSLGLNVSF